MNRRLVVVILYNQRMCIIIVGIYCRYAICATAIEGARIYTRDIRSPTINHRLLSSLPPNPSWRLPVWSTRPLCLQLIANMSPTRSDRIRATTISSSSECYLLDFFFSVWDNIRSAHCGSGQTMRFHGMRWKNLRRRRTEPDMFDRTTRYRRTRKYI